MDINQLKSNWSNPEAGNYEEKELVMMTRINTHPVLKKIKAKLIIESVLLSAVLFFYYDGFDGHTKPFYVNAMLVISILLFIGNDLLAFRLISNPVSGENIRESINKQLTLLRRVSVFSVASSSVYGISLLLFLTSTIRFTGIKYVMLGGLIITLTGMMIYSFQKWKSKIRILEDISSEFDQK